MLNSKHFSSKIYNIMFCIIIHTVEEEIDRREGERYSFNSTTPPDWMDGFTTRMKKRMHRRMDAWQNGSSEKWMINLVHTTPNHHPPKMDILQKTFLQIILAVKWIVRPPNSSDDLCLLFCLFLLLWCEIICDLLRGH